MLRSGAAMALLVGPFLAACGASTADATNEVFPFVAEAAPDPPLDPAPPPPRTPGPDDEPCGAQLTIEVDAQTSPPPVVYRFVVSNAGATPCALGGVPELEVIAATGHPVDVPRSHNPVPESTNPWQPDRFLLEPADRATLGVQWGDFCPPPEEASPSVHFVVRTLGREVALPAVTPPPCVAGPTDLRLRVLSWLPIIEAPPRVSTDPLLGQPLSIRLTDLTYPGGDSLRAVLEVRNAGADEVPLDPCPWYELTVGEGGRGSTEYWYLNCDQAPAAVPPGDVLSFEVLVPEPPTSWGQLFLRLGDPGAAENADYQRSAELEYDLP